MQKQSEKNTLKTIYLKSFLPNIQKCSFKYATTFYPGHIQQFNLSSFISVDDLSFFQRKLNRDCQQIADYFQVYDIHSFIYISLVKQQNFNRADRAIPTATMNSKDTKIYHISTNYKGIDIDLRMTFPSAILRNLNNLNEHSQPLEAQTIQEISRPNEEAPLSRKERIQMMMKFKNSDIPEQFLQRQVASNMNSSTLARSSNDRPSSQLRQERSRTRQNPIQQRRDFAASSPDVRRVQKDKKVNPISKKLAFFPKFNENDEIYSISNQCYSLISGKSPGFMIVNNYPCHTRDPSYIEFQIKLSNIEEDDLGIGITYRPVDMIKNKIKKNPAKRCMAYYFSSKKMRVCDQTYQAKVPYSEIQRYRLIVNPISKVFILINSSKEFLIKKSIPQEFFEQQIFYFLELKNKGRITIL